MLRLFVLTALGASTGNSRGDLVAREGRVYLGLGHPACGWARGVPGIRLPGLVLHARDHGPREHFHGHPADSLADEGAAKPGHAAGRAVRGTRGDVGSVEDRQASLHLKSLRGPILRPDTVDVGPAAPERLPAPEERIHRMADER